MPRSLIAVVGICLILASLSLSLPLTMLGQIGESLRVSGGLLDWVVIAGSLTGTVGTALLPPLSSLIGQRTVMAAAMGLLALGGSLCAVAPNLAVLLVGRSVGGLSLGALALSFAIARTNVAGRTLRTVLGWIAAAEGVAFGAGFLFSGLLTGTVRVSWRTVFWLLAILALIAAVLAFRTIPRTPARLHDRIDWLGGALLTAALVLILVPLSMGSSWGWDSAAVLVPLISGVAVTAAWWTIESRVERPLVNARALRNRNFFLGWAVFFLAGAMAFTINFTIPEFTQAPVSTGFGLGYRPLASGLVMLCFCAGIVVASGSAGAITRIVPPRSMCLFAFGGCVASMLALAFLHSTNWQLWTWPAVFGISYGLAVSGAYMTFIQALEVGEVATAAGIGAIAGPVGSVIGSAGITAVLTANVITVGTRAIPSERSFQVSWLIGAGAAVAGLVLVVCIRPSRQ